MKKIIIYARLSQKHHNQKDLSLKNQIALCKRAVRNEIPSCRLEEQILILEDAGFSGQNFHRPGFEKMMDLVRQGEVEWILVKDLSRLGRNYEKVGYYMEKIFPRYQVRFTAIGDGYDSREREGKTSVYPLRNLLYEWYAKDIGKKVKQVKMHQREKGMYLGAVPPYGYQIENRILRRDSSYVVVFAMVVLHYNQKSSGEIGKWLEQNKISNPTAYNRTKQLYGTGQEIIWNSGTIRRILKREISHSRGDHYTA